MSDYFLNDDENKVVEFMMTVSSNPSIEELVDGTGLSYQQVMAAIKHLNEISNNLHGRDCFHWGTQN